MANVNTKVISGDKHSLRLPHVLAYRIPTDGWPWARVKGGKTRKFADLSLTTFFVMQMRERMSRVICIGEEVERGWFSFVEAERHSAQRKCSKLLVVDEKAWPAS